MAAMRSRKASAQRYNAVRLVEREVAFMDGTLRSLIVSVSRPGMKKRRTGPGRLLFVAVVVLLTGVVLSGVMLRYLGVWLVTAEPLERSAAIVVMGGGFPYRPAAAAELYK